MYCAHISEFHGIRKGAKEEKVMNFKENYEELEMEVIEFEAEDVIVTSGEGPDETPIDN